MVTEIDRADSISEAFAHPPVSRAELVTTASTAQADPHVIDALERLPEGNYSMLRDLWRHLGDVPASYRIELVNGSSRYQEVHRWVRTDGTVRLDRRGLGEGRACRVDEIVKISKLDVEINGAWRWSAVFTQEPVTQSVSA